MSDQMVFTQQFKIHSIQTLNNQLTAAHNKLYKQYPNTHCYIIPVKNHDL